MPVKRRRVKARAELMQGERLFLAGAPWPLDEYEGSNPVDRYRNWITHCWLSAGWRKDNPSGGPTALPLWEAYGSGALEAWRGPGPHPAVKRFGAPPPSSAGINPGFH